MCSALPGVPSSDALQLRLSLTLSASRAEMQRALTDMLAEDGQPDFTLEWGTGRGTNSAMPANVGKMSLRQLEIFVLSLQKASMEMSRELHRIQPPVDYTCFIYMVNGTKRGHDNSGMCPADVRERCVLEHCEAIVKVGAMSTKGVKHPAGRYGTPPPRLLYLCVAR